MSHDDFKKLFGDVAAKFGFERAYGGWFMESHETIIVLDLQKSNYGDYYYLNIKIYVQGLFGNRYRREKKLVKGDVGDVFTRAPTEYDEIFKMETGLDISDRANRLYQLFSEYIQPMITLASTRGGVLELGNSGRLYLLPAVRQALLDMEI